MAFLGKGNLQNSIPVLKHFSPQNTQIVFGDIWLARAFPMATPTFKGHVPGHSELEVMLFA